MLSITLLVACVHLRHPCQLYTKVLLSAGSVPWDTSWKVSKPGAFLCVGPLPTPQLAACSCDRDPHPCRNRHWRNFGPEGFEFQVPVHIPSTSYFAMVLLAAVAEIASTWAACRAIEDCRTYCADGNGEENVWHFLNTPYHCRFAHDAVRWGNRALIASTGDGALLELQLPSLGQVKRHQFFTSNDHVNALAPLGNGSVWCLLHNHGEVCQSKGQFTIDASCNVSS